MIRWQRTVTGTSYAVQSLARGLRNAVRRELLQAGTARALCNLCERQTRAVANYLERFVEHSAREHLFTCDVSGSVEPDGTQSITIRVTCHPDPYAENKHPTSEAA